MKSDIYGSIIVGAVFFGLIWVMSLMLPEEEPEMVYIWNEDLCEQVIMRSPGGLTLEVAEVCYVPGYGWHKTKNTGRLLDDQYDSLISPLYRQVRYTARAMGLYDEDHNLHMYRGLRAAQDAYQGRD